MREQLGFVTALIVFVNHRLTQPAWHHHHQTASYSHVPAPAISKSSFHPQAS
jgi:hypothetical protein